MSINISRTVVLSGGDLIADINNCSVGPRQIAVWWLGQHSFVVKAGPTIIYIDPFLTPMPERLVPTLLTPPQITHADIVCGSHDHADHIDRPVWPALAAAAPQAKFIVPDLLRAGLARDLGISADRLVGLDDGTSVELAGVRITALASSHEFLDQDPATGKFPYLGFVFEANGCTWYHSGDTVWYEGLQTKLRPWAFDLMLLPINGRDARRLSTGIIGNMTYQEAADLSGPLQPRLVIPTHYEMFAGNPGDPVAFQEYMQVKYPAVPTRICRHGERFLVEARPRA
jgi:L-ascorbate metabolism protein UlaG (beta-lactamase superfamily)